MDTEDATEWVPGFVSSILFSDEANFYVSGEVNKQNVRYWMVSNPHWMSDSKRQGVEKFMAWCGIWVTELLVRAAVIVCRHGRETIGTYPDDIRYHLLKKDKH
ncbi:hypothetical protein AVEN_261712-1 [Araneus ventricosus]|uniref:Uncharacterized protein n=1 Tax=Araneus ventricosus TaxID=182803 RepID=A0A4Y2DV06_ARAVE|nr:hypothetical protein AVEN_261712-1 [Araneus ventricosus]